MKVEYDRDVDIHYIRFRGLKVKKTRMICEDAHTDIDDEDEFVSIHIWRAAENTISKYQRGSEKIKPLLEKVNPNLN